MPTQVTHHKIIGGANWGLSKQTLELVEQARARGVDVSIDAYPYTASSTGSAALIPQWAQEGGQKALVERLNAPAQRARIKTVVIDNIKIRSRGGRSSQCRDGELRIRQEVGREEFGGDHEGSRADGEFRKCGRDAAGNPDRGRMFRRSITRSAKKTSNGF